MTIREAIARLDGLMPNTYTTENKISWLSRVDSMIKQQIIETHEGGEDITFHGYNSETDQSTKLIADEPHDEMYIRFMEAQIHYNNGEYDRYNNAITMFQSLYESYAAWYVRRHTPIAAGRRFLF